MKRMLLLLAAVSVVALPVSALAKDWDMKATIIEACSCPMFCQCYFNTEPAGGAGHGGHAGHGAAENNAGHGVKGGHASHATAAGASDHFCKFNNAFRVDKGTFGGVKLDGAKFWVAGDLGAEFTDGEMEWAVLTFDPSVTPEQREGIKTILGAVYPVKWKAFSVAPDAKMDWTYTKDRAEARLDGGKVAEVVLNRGDYGNTAEPIVIHNLRYWGVPRNDGFVLMKNEVQAYHAGKDAFEYKGTNGFMITFDMTSKDVKM
jgi:hypothetical protein